MARALYIHWPFCAKKCPYCDFNSHVRATVDTEAWREALLADMRAEAAVAGGESLHSIFFGGGTPSLMPPALAGELIEEAQNLWALTRVSRSPLRRIPPRSKRRTSLISPTRASTACHSACSPWMTRRCNGWAACTAPMKLKRRLALRKSTSIG